MFRLLAAIVLATIISTWAAAQGFTPVVGNGVSAVVAKASPGTLWGITVLPSADGVLQIIDATSVPANGSIGTPVKCYKVVANVSIGVEWPNTPIWFPTGIVAMVSPGNDCSIKASRVTAYFSVNAL